jgi:integrase
VVKPSGAKAWMLRVQVAGKRHDVGLGGDPAVSLKEAREKAETMRKQARAGIDPIEEREAARREREAARKALEEAQACTFRAVAEACIQSQAPGWKDRKTAVMWRNSLERWAYPEIGDMPVAAIDKHAVMRAISAVWRKRPATARKVLRRIGAVLRYAAAHGWRANDNPADARMLRNMGLPALPGGRNLPSLSWARIPLFWVALDNVEGMGAAALRFAILTALRSGEVRKARWNWISFEGPVPVLTVPGEAMKGKRSAKVLPHRVPLAPAALEVLARAYREATGLPCTVAELPKRAALAGEALIFPSATRRTPISDMTMSAVMRRMNADCPRGAPPPWRDAKGRARRGMAEPPHYRHVVRSRKAKRVRRSPRPGARGPACCRRARRPAPSAPLPHARGVSENTSEVFDGTPEHVANAKLTRSERGVRAVSRARSARATRAARRVHSKKPKLPPF